MVHSATFVDVRDIAEAHTRALKTPAAGGQRFIISAGCFKYQDFGAYSAIFRLDED